MTELDQGPREPGRLRRVLRVVLIVGGVLALVVVLGGLWANHKLTSQLGSIDGAFDGLSDRPENGPGLDVLLEAEGTRVVSVLHFAEDRRSAALVAVLAVDGWRQDETVAEVERATGVRIDHVARLEGSFYRELTDTVDGITLDVGDNGRQRLDGDQVAKEFLTSGPVAEQANRLQRVLRALTTDALHTSMRKKPWQLWGFLDTVTRHVAVDRDWSDGDLRGLVWSLRDMRTRNIVYLSAGRDDAALWVAVAEDRVAAWLADNPERALPDTPL